MLGVTQTNPIVEFLSSTGASTAQIQVPGTQATGASDVPLCFSTTGIFTQGATCGVSLAKYKDVTGDAHGLDYVMRMRPVRFNWKATGAHDIGMIADEVAAIDPLLGAYCTGVSDDPASPCQHVGDLYNFRDRAVLSTLVQAVKEIEVQVQELKRK